MSNARTIVKRKKRRVTRQTVGKVMKPACVDLKADQWKGWKKKVLIAVPTTGLVRVEWMMARFGQIIPCNWANGDIFQYYSQYSPMGWEVADARNVCVDHAIKQNFEWMFFIDHDVLLPQDTFLKLNEYMRSEKYPVVSGLYYCKGSHPEPLCYRGRGTSFYDRWDAGDKFMVDGIPMGCCLIHMSLMRYLYDHSEQYCANTISGQIVMKRVFETPRKAWFDPETQKYNSQSGTEDIFWCDRLKKEKVFEKCGVKRYAKYQKMKYPLLMDTSICCRHIDELGRQYGK